MRILRHFRAGRVAAIRQLLVIVPFIAVILFLSRLRLVEPLTVGSVDRPSASTFVNWGCLLLGLHSALARGQAKAETAAFIRSAASRMRPAAPHQIIQELSARLWLAAGSFAVLTLVPAPALLTAVAFNPLCAEVVALGWPAMTSVVMSYFIANGLAARG